MERRLKLLEKLKSTKLNKLTVKQGGVDVKLNLKRDLANQAVSIDDKVLDMLEKYVENQNNSGAAVTNSSASMGDDARNLDDVAATNRTLSSTAAGSPAKKVRFDVNSVQSTSPAENLATAVRLLGQLRTTSQTVQRNLQSSDRIDTPVLWMFKSLKMYNSSLFDCLVEPSYFKSKYYWFEVMNFFILVWSEKMIKLIKVAFNLQIYILNRLLC